MEFAGTESAFPDIYFQLCARLIVSCNTWPEQVIFIIDTGGAGVASSDSYGSPDDRVVNTER